MWKIRSRSMPSEHLTAKRLRRRLVLIYLRYACLAIFATALLVLFGLNFTRRQLFFGLALAPIVTLITVVIDIFIINLYFRPVGAFLQVLKSESPQPRVATAALIRVLNLPILTFLRVMFVHGPVSVLATTALVLLVANPYFNTGYKIWHIITVGWSIMLVGSAAHAIFEYFAVSNAIRPIIAVIRRHCGELSSEDRERVIRISVRKKLLLVAIFVTCIPLIVIGFTVAVKVYDLLPDSGVLSNGGQMLLLLMWIISFVAFSVIVTLAVSVLMARDITRLLEKLSQGMSQVEAGKLETYLEGTTTDEFSDLFDGFNQMAGGLRERERLRDAFGKYISPEVAQEIMRHGIELGGNIASVSVLFADIRNFTALSEKMAATAVVNLLNRYFAAVDSAIRAEGGWINKFGGDSLLAVFGIVAPQAGHVSRAVRAAFQMRAVLSELNTRQHESKGPSLAIGVGVHCGQVMVGNVGSPDRLEYTVIGDTVNVASRIESLNKEYGTDILISAEVYETVKREVSARMMPLAVVKGLSKPIQVYALDDYIKERSAFAENAGQL